jgi:lipopolysaccharide transport system ATP-binding protein
MKDEVILKIENLSKQYRLGVRGTGTLSHDINKWWASLRGKEDPYLKVGDQNDRTSKGKSEYVWALQDISFEVKKGEVLGIIGKNGAGKSTLLKILSQITSPTLGTIKSKGRIASLLEVGTGFHPEMTGRENIYLNGAILGMTKKEIRSKLEEIISFSGCERYIDTPVKRYSSGMKVRLAFAVAAHLEPDILVVDEVLAVGDAEFQKKAIGKMKSISKGEGRTVLFVSHDMNAIATITEKVCILKNGMMHYYGDTDVGIKTYLTDATNVNDYVAEVHGKAPQITKAQVKTSLPNFIHEFGKPLRFNFEIAIPKNTKNLAISFQILDEFLNPITHLWNFDSDNNTEREEGVFDFNCNLDNPLLYMGNYSIRVFLSDSKSKERFDYIDAACSFRVEMMKEVRSDYQWSSGAAKYLEKHQWTIKRV